MVQETVLALGAAQEHSQTLQAVLDSKKAELQELQSHADQLAADLQAFKDQACSQVRAASASLICTHRSHT